MPTITPTIVEPVFLDRDTINAMYARYGIDPIGGGSQEGDENPDDGDQNDEGDGEGDLPPDLGDKGKEALKAERKAKAAALKRARELETELQTLRDAKTEADRLAQEAKDAKALEDGQAKELAQERGVKLAERETELAALTTKFNDLVSALKPEVDAAWNDVPEEIRAFYDGADDDVLAKRAFLAKSKPAIDRMNAEQDKQKEALRGFSNANRTPQPDHRAQNAGDDEAARQRQARTVSTI
jgi:hypothetical protein